MNCEPVSNSVILASERFHHVTVEVVHGDAMAECTQVILNTPNHDFESSVATGMTQQMYLSCGPRIQLSTNPKQPTPFPKWKNGEVCVTKANLLLRRRAVHYVIHNCSYVYNTTQLQELLRNTFDAANQIGAVSLALPTPCSGSYGLPKEEANKLLLDALVRFLFEKGEITSVKLIRICNTDLGNSEIAADYLDSLAHSSVGQELKRM
eukprot:PhF_6_TR19550/c0_g1_i1/m.28517